MRSSVENLSRLSFRHLFLVPLAAVALLASCTTMAPPTGGSYQVTAYKPHDPANVEVKLSLSTQNVYVMEGDRLLMAAQGERRQAWRSDPDGQLPHLQQGQNAHAAQSEPDAGYPMAYWCEFKPAYGFHEGFVHPYPHTHGCVRMHREAAARLFALVHIGTPGEYIHTQPEDAKYGSQVRKLDQSHDPDPPRSS